jgi:hypothetical protein
LKEPVFERKPNLLLGPEEMPIVVFSFYKYKKSRSKKLKRLER